MSIPTQMSLTGFIAATPELHFASNGTDYCRVRIGVEQGRKEVDGSFTRLEPTFHNMVAFEGTAREVYARFRRGDSFVASGYVHEYEVKTGAEAEAGSVVKEEFVVRKIGHNANKTAYEVQRRLLTPSPTLGPAAPLAGQEPPDPAVGF